MKYFKKFCNITKGNVNCICVMLCIESMDFLPISLFWKQLIAEMTAEMNINLRDTADSTIQNKKYTNVKTFLLKRDKS